MTTREPDRVRVSTRAHGHAQAALKKFPEFGTTGKVHRVSAMLSLRKNGYLESRPEDVDVDNDHPARLPGAIEMSTAATRFLLFPAIVQLLAERRLGLDEVYDQVGYHIHLGSALLNDLSAQASDFSELYKILVEEIPLGREVGTHAIDGMTGGSDAKGLTLGTDQEGNNAFWPLNDTATVENPHACIIGVSGQGKTQFVLDLLVQLREQNPDLTFTILDYKGDLSDDGSSARRMFEDHLQCRIAVPGVSPVPAVPFQKPQSFDREQYALGVTDLIGRFYPQLGSQQRLALREALVDVMSGDSGVQSFGFEMLGDRLVGSYNEKGRRDDGLMEVISRLRVLQLFEETPSEQNTSPLLNGSLLVRLNELAADTLPAAFLLISRLYEEMRRLPDASRRGSIVELRHVIFIDEAHHYLSQRSSPLARIIREGRSKGVAVFLATQSVSDLAGAAGADYREFISNSFFFKTNLRSNADIRAMVPSAAQRIQAIANAISELGLGEMLFTRNLRRDLRSSVINAVQYYRRA